MIQEYLAKFSHLQAFYDPVLFNHMDEIGFIPDLYAIPWVLTMFSHVFPLHKIFHLWDTLLLGNSSYPLCVGLAILLQLRSQLLESQFNECILLFSEMPSVDIDQVVSQSKLISEAVPPSLLFRANDQPDNFVKSQVNINSSAGYTDLDLPHLPVSLLKSEKVGRMSGRDCIAMLDTRQEGYSPAKLQVQLLVVRAFLVPAGHRSEPAENAGSGQEYDIQIGRVVNDGFSLKMQKKCLNVVTLYLSIFIYNLSLPVSLYVLFNIFDNNFLYDLFI